MSLNKSHICCNVTIYMYIQIQEKTHLHLLLPDTQTDPDFCVVARVEAFIAGWGLDEALRRAEAYRNAGADAILMHSKKSDPSDIEAFMKAWNNQVHTWMMLCTLQLVVNVMWKIWEIQLLLARRVLYQVTSYLSRRNTLTLYFHWNVWEVWFSLPEIKTSISWDVF